MSTSPLPLLALLVLAACAAPADREDPYQPDRPVEADVPQGLTPDQAESLMNLGIPVVVPSAPGAFEVVGVRAQATAGFADYDITYRRADGACFEVYGGVDGYGGPELPIVSTEVQVPGLGQTVRVHQASSDMGATSAMDFGPGTVISSEIWLDNAAATFRSVAEDGCRALSLDEAVPLVRSLIRIAPSSRPIGDVSSLGRFAPADDLLEGANIASSPGLAADAIAGRYDGEADRISVEVLSETSYEATALVTALGLYDDSIRDERLRLTYTPYNGSWELTAAGRQVRCQRDRGHQDWSDEACF